jgi:hypothetical protein
LLIIDEILELLRNGQWHELKEITEKTQLRELKIQLITSFLIEYDFLEYDKDKKKIRLSPTVRAFLKKIDVAGREKTRENKRQLMVTSNFFQNSIFTLWQ